MANWSACMLFSAACGAAGTQEPAAPEAVVSEPTLPTIGDDAMAAPAEDGAPATPEATDRSEGIRLGQTYPVMFSPGG